MGRLAKGWALRPLGALLRESRVPGSDGASAKKLTIRLHRKGIVAKEERSPGSSKTKYYRRFSGQLLYSKLDFFNGAMGILPPELDGRESTADLPAFDLGPDLDPRWLIEFLGRPSLYQRYAELGRGSRQAQRLGVREFLSIEVPLPSLEEQRRIAGVLDRFDAAKEASLALLAETQKVQVGAVARLISGETKAGLRKASALGEIPVSWQRRSLQDLALPDRQCVMTGPYGALLSTGDFQASGVGVLKIGNLKEDGLDLERLDYVSESKAQSLARYRLQAHDLVFARQGATTGKVAVIDEQCSGYLISCHLIRVSVDPRICLAEFLRVYFQSSRFLSQLEITKIKGTREGVNSKELRSVQLALPPLHEQAQIVERARAFTAALAEQKRAMQQLVQLKARVSDDLMCGRVRA